MKQVLFVDDERSALSALERMLRPQRDRWDMTFALGASEALAYLERGQVDVVVTDMRMPGMDGSALLDIVRVHHPDAVRIILSGEVDVANEPGIAKLAHRLLSKPCGSEAIIEAVDQACASLQNN